MDVNKDSTVGEIVRINFKAAQLFDAHGIDFCCGGNISLSEACSDSPVDLNTLLGEIDSVLSANDPETKFIEGMALDQLSDYIMSRHHSYVSETVPFLQQKLQKLCDVHGSHHPELFEIREHFGTMATNLASHMEKEENVLFPLVHKMVERNTDGQDTAMISEEIRKTITELEEEHQGEGKRLGNIAALSNQYTMPPDGCNTFQVTYQTLEEFEKDLHRHIHLENNVLFKKLALT